MIELRQRIGQRFVVGTAVAEAVDGSVDSVAQWRGIGNTLAGDVVARGEIGSRSYQRQSSKIADIVVGMERLERCQSLIVVHGKNGIEVIVVALLEEEVSLIGSEDVDTGICQLLNGRHNVFGLFLSLRLFVNARIEGEHGDAGIGDTHVAAQRGEENSHLLDDVVRSDGGRNILQADLVSHECQPHVTVDKQTLSFLALTDALLDVFGTTRKVEAAHMGLPIVGRCTDKYIEESVFVVGDGTVESFHGSQRGIWRGNTQFHLDLLVDSRNDVELSVLGSTGVVDDSEVVFDAQSLAMISGNLGRAIYNRSAELKHICLLKSFEYKLVADTVGAAVGDGHAYFVVVHGCLVLYNSLEYFYVRNH